MFLRFGETSGEMIDSSNLKPWGLDKTHAEFQFGREFYFWQILLIVESYMADLMSWKTVSTGDAAYCASGLSG